LILIIVNPSLLIYKVFYHIAEVFSRKIKEFLNILHNKIPSKTLSVDDVKEI